MKKIVWMGLFVAAFCIGCSQQVLPAGMHNFKLGEKMDIEGTRIHFKLNKSGDSLFVHIHKSWSAVPAKEVRYEVSLYDKNQQLIQSKIHEFQPKYSTMNISLNLSMIDKSNVDRAAYFSIKVSE
jgi:hypothetical protein